MMREAHALLIGIYFQFDDLMKLSSIIAYTYVRTWSKKQCVSLYTYVVRTWQVSQFHFEGDKKEREREIEIKILSFSLVNIIGMCMEGGKKSAISYLYRRKFDFPLGK